MKNYEKIMLTVGLFIGYFFWVSIVKEIPRWSLLFPLVFAPLIEELVFRKAVIEICLRTKRGSHNVYYVILITSFIFGAIHWNTHMFIIQGVLGFVLSYLYLKTRSYWLIVLFHAGWNVSVHYGMLYLIIK